MKKCSKCGIEQSLDNFYRASETRDGYRGDCKACFQARAKARYPLVREQAIERTRQWAADNPDRVKARQAEYRASGRKAISDRKSHLRRKYGITPAEYDELLDRQGGGCAICGRPPTPGISLHVDHDHATGAIRGLLCFRCNNALGDFDDDRDRLWAALAYLGPAPADQELDELARRRVRALIDQPA